MLFGGGVWVCSDGVMERVSELFSPLRIEVGRLLRIMVGLR